MLPPFVLLRANDICFLGSARASAAVGAPIRTVAYTWPGAGPWYSERSKHVVDSTVISNPYADPEGALRGLFGLTESLRSEFGERPMAIPSSDTNMMLLLDHPEVVGPQLRMMGDAGLDRGRNDIAHKHTVAEILTAAGVPTPVTFACQSAGDIDAIVEQVPYPCIYKPLRKDYGMTFYAAHGGSKAIEADTADALRSKLGQEMEAGFPVVVQEKVPFDAVVDEIPVYVYVDAQHRVRMAATAVKHTIQPHPFGTATVLYLTWHPELLEAAQRVADAVKWRGILMIEFIRDQRDDTWKVIELNGRPWLFVDFFRRFGLNYLAYLYDDLRGHTEHWPDLRVPEPALLDSQPVHISLPRAVEPTLAALDRKPQPQDVAAYLETLPGRRTLTFLDPEDPEPGRAELHDLAERYGMDPDSLLDTVHNVLSGD